jgi:ribosome recycling factor
MDIDEILLECEDKMDKAVEFLKGELKGIRTGRASPALVEYVKVDYYGSPTDLRQLAQVSVPEPTQLLIKPHDPSALQAMVQGIQAAGLGLNPMSEGKAIRINLPPLNRARLYQGLPADTRATIYPQVAPRLRELCEKYDIDFEKAFPPPPSTDGDQN